MSKAKSTDELVAEITTLLAKHEVHNEVLIVELALLVLKREKTVLKQGKRLTQDTLNKAFKR